MIHEIHELVWGPWLLAGFLGVGFYYTIRSRFFQIRKFGYWMGQTGGSIGKSGINEGKGTSGEVERKPAGTEKEAEKKAEKKVGKKAEKKGENGVGQFQTACTALAATIGTGNIAGVATALTAGGPGAVFWMWVSAGIGMMTAYGETSLGIRYRERKPDGSWLCGPMVFLDKGLKCPFLALFYGFCCIMTALGMGSMVQANSLAQTVCYSGMLPPAAVGAALTLLVFGVIRGGIKRIAAVAEKLVPLSAGIYFFFSMAVILSCFPRIPGVFALIFRSAFCPSSVLGGAAGVGVSKSIQYGISRGVFSNEAGLGTLAILHGAAGNSKEKNLKGVNSEAVKQGMWAMFEVFVDTIVICTLTALVILLMTEETSGSTGTDGAALTAVCFSKKMGKAGGGLVAVSMAVFAFATIIAWYYLGKQAVAYVGDRCAMPSSLSDLVYTSLYLNAVFWGCVLGMEAVWEFADIWNGLLAVPNLIALVGLRKIVTDLDNGEIFPYTQKTDKRE